MLRTLQLNFSLWLLAVLLCTPLDAAAADGARFVRFGEPGAERPGLLDERGRIRDLSAHLADISPETVGELDDLARLDPDGLPAVSGEPRLGPPISRAGKIVAVGFNYRDHAEEMGRAIPTEPVLFMKAANALSGPFDPVISPRGATELDYEVELVVVIGRTASYVAEADALSYIAGFAVGHDIPKLEAWLGSAARLSNENVLDVQRLWTEAQPPGLAQCASKFSSKTLSKEQQRSDWSVRPLSDKQLEYAALDAAVLLAIVAERASRGDRMQQ